MNASDKELFREAEEVLRENWRGGYTIPSPTLYPFQWLWDSGFIALGLAYIDPERAVGEIESLFVGQWDNGMIPHIIFHRENDAYYPGPGVWRTPPKGPDAPRTSGISQPPVLGFILERILDLVVDREPVEVLIRKLYPRLAAFHRYWRRDRDPGGEDLCYLRHNWESGLDNAPVWDHPLSQVPVTGESLAPFRKDLAHVDPSQRPDDTEYQRYIWLVNLFAEYEYDEQKLFERCPFRLQDPLTNALLIASDRALHRLGERLGLHEQAETFRRWGEEGTRAMNQKLHDPGTGLYRAFDLQDQQPIAAPYLPAFAAALFGGIPDQEAADRFVQQTIIPLARDDSLYLMPTVPPGSRSFSPRNYWRGPIWVNINWLLYHGLQRYGYEEWAMRVREDTIALITQYGFHEYFNPLRTRGKGYGTDRFSWSAALAIDLLHQ